MLISTDSHLGLSKVLLLMVALLNEYLMSTRVSLLNRKPGSVWHMGVYSILSTALPNTDCVCECFLPYWICAHVLSLMKAKANTDKPPHTELKGSIYDNNGYYA